MPLKLPDHLRPGPGQRLFAWNGIAFLTTKNWELASTELHQGVSRIVLEDDACPRLELDWFSTDSEVARDKVQRRCQKQSRALTEAATKVLPIEGLNREWTAHEYRMPDASTLVVGYCLPSHQGRPFAFFRLHFPTGHADSPAVAFRSLARSFSWWKSGLAPWAFYDVAFTLNRDYHLASTALQAGRKMLAFEWRLRRLFIWHFSLADYILRTQTAAEWCRDFLNSCRFLPVPIWHLDAEGKLSCRRKRLYFLGQFEEIGRLCFKYQAVCRHLPEQNQIVLWVIHYRRPSDLLHLAEAFPEQDTPLSEQRQAKDNDSHAAL